MTPVGRPAAAGVPQPGDSRPLRAFAGALGRGAFRDARRILRSGGRAADYRAEKAVSRRRRFVGLLVPKVASRSLMAALRNAVPDLEIFRDASIAEVLSACPEARGYFSFAFVRHPFTRALSLHRELFRSPALYAGQYARYRDRREAAFFDPAAGREVRFRSSLAELASPARKEDKRRRLFRAHSGLAGTGGFEDFCAWLTTPSGSDALADRHFLSQHLQIRSADRCLPDFVGRFEDFDRDLAELARRLEIPPLRMPVLNTMAGWQASREELGEARREAVADLTERARELLAARYAEDFAVGGYPVSSW